ncbi:MAG: hypothetical protein HYX27_14865 [Acidobacteria bacterium]|nr:hypothetical protein [Acidobacteriota bacterium]
MWKLRAVSNYEEGYYAGVRFPDVPGVIAFGRDCSSATELGIRSAAFALGRLIDQRRDLPLAIHGGGNIRLVEIPPRFAAKLVLRRAMAEKGWTTEILAKELKVSVLEAGSILDLDGPDSTGLIRKAFAKMRRTVELCATGRSASAPSPAY